MPLTILPEQELVLGLVFIFYLVQEKFSVAKKQLYKQFQEKVAVQLHDQFQVNYILHKIVSLDQDV